MTTDTTAAIDLDGVGRALAREDELYAAECQLLAERILLLARLDASEFWKAEGFASLGHWLVATRGVGRSTASEWIRVGRSLLERPELARRFRSGELSWDKVKAATRLAEHEAEEEVAEQAASSAVSTLNRRVREARRAHASADHRDRYLKWWWDDDRPLLHLEGVLPDDQGVVVAKALDLLAHDRLPDPRYEDGKAIYEPYEAGCADALYRMASEALGTDRRSDMATVVLHVDASDLTTSSGNGTIDDRPVLPETALRFACDARIEANIEDDGVTIGVGRMTRTIPPWLRRKMQDRDQGCVFPGCERTRWVHRHHIRHWAHGGPTDLDNLVTLCPYHHRLIHEGGWSIAGDPNEQLTWFRPDGTPYRPRYPRRVSPSAKRAMSERAGAWETFRIRGSCVTDTS